MHVMKIQISSWNAYSLYILTVISKTPLFSPHDAFITIHQHKKSKAEEERGRRKTNITSKAFSAQFLSLNHQPYYILIYSFDV